MLRSSVIVQLLKSSKYLNQIKWPKMQLLNHIFTLSEQTAPKGAHGEHNSTPSENP